MSLRKMDKRSKRKKILFIKQYSANAKFVTNDIDFLRKNFDVVIYNTKTKNNVLIIITLLKQFFYLILNAYRFKFAYIWFADYHSVLPVLAFKLLGKRSIICTGGYEATYIPEINCGVFTNETFAKTIRKFAVEFSLKKCNLILPVDETLVSNENLYIYSNIPGKHPLKDGITHFIPSIKTEIKTIHPGYDSNMFFKRNNIAKEKIVMCAGLIPNEYEIKRKGFDLLAEAAKKITDTKFVLIGFIENMKEQFEKLNLINLELHGIVSYEELIYHYSRAKVFAQISMFEGFPSTLCEAMLCECIPVGSNVNGIPNIIDGKGFIIKEKNLDEIVSNLINAINSPEELGKKARQYIIESYSIEKREKALNDVAVNFIS